MRRRLLDLLTVLSLLLCVAAAGLWVRSYSTLDACGWIVSDGGAGHKGYCLTSANAVLKITHWHERAFRFDEDLGFFRSWLDVDWALHGPIVGAHQRFGWHSGPFAVRR